MVIKSNFKQSILGQKIEVSVTLDNLLNTHESLVYLKAIKLSNSYCNIGTGIKVMVSLDKSLANFPLKSTAHFLLGLLKALIHSYFMNLAKKVKLKLLR